MLLEYLHFSYVLRQLLEIKRSIERFIQGLLSLWDKNKDVGEICKEQDKKKFPFDLAFLSSVYRLDQFLVA